MRRPRPGSPTPDAPRAVDALILPTAMRRRRPEIDSARRSSKHLVHHAVHAVGQRVDLALAEQVRRHQIDGLAYGSQKQCVSQRGAKDLVREIGRRIGDVPRPDHAELAKVPHPRVAGDRLQSGGEPFGAQTVRRQDIVLFQHIEHCQCGAAGERVAGKAV